MTQRAPLLYRALILLFPAPFRRQYGRQMEHVFASMLDRLGSDRRGRAALWTRAIPEILWHAGVERMHHLRSAPSSGRRSARRALPSTVLRDIRLTLRGARRMPGYAAAFIITLGLGIGANAAIFSVVNGVLLRPLPHTGGDAIVHLEQWAVMAGLDYQPGFSLPELADYRDGVEAFVGVAEYSPTPLTILGIGDPGRVNAGVVSGDFFRVMGLRPALGRLIDAGDATADAEPVAVLSHETWSQTFSRDPSIVGQTFSTNERVVTIVGVLERVPQYPRAVDYFVNVAVSPHHSSASMQFDRGHRMTGAFARLQPGTDAAAARLEFKQVAARLHTQYPEHYAEHSRFRVELIGLRDGLVANARPTLMVLMGTAAFVLIIACANVANLTLTRMVRRERELAVRAALGAGVGRLRQQLLVENLVLSFIGVGLGLVIATIGLDVMVALAARYTPRASEIGMDGTVLAFATAIGMGAAAVFAWTPSLPMTHHLSASLTEGGRSTGGVRRRRAQRLLVVAQLAVSFVLLIGAGLFVQTLVRLNRIDPGFDPQRVLTMSVPGVPGDRAARQAFFAEALDRIEAHPGVQAAAVAMVTPFRSSPMTHSLQVEGRALEPGAAPPVADFRSVSAGYFIAVGMPLLRGRTFAPTDDRNAPGVVVISQSMADYYFPDGDAVGRRIAWEWDNDQEAEWKTVVGVVADSRAYALDATPIHTVFQPYAQEPWGTSLFVRTIGEPNQIAQDVARAIREIDPDLPVENVATMEELKAESVAPQRLNAAMFGSFALLALLIAAVGVSGVLAFAVSQRQHEFGIRLTLGADHSRVLLMILREGGTLAAIGLGIGAVIALVASRFVAGFLFEVTPTDPLTFVGVGALLLIVAIGASLVPARRATRVDPIDALRAE